MNNNERVAVCSRSFSRNSVLREELLDRYPQATFNDAGEKLQGQKLIAFLRGHSKAIVALERIDQRLLEALPDLQIISKYGVGLDTIDLQAMHRLGRCLGWTGGVNRRSVSELVISCCIGVLRHLPVANREILEGGWRQVTGGQLSGRTVGIVGCGFVGKDLVTLLQPFGCRILVNDIRDYAEFYRQYDIRPLPLDTLLASSDIVTLHVPLDDSTRGMLTDERLALMKPDAVLINTARGGLVDEAALKRRLKSGRLAGAAFDVFAQEPPTDPELLALPNFLATPHIGGSAGEAILAMGRSAISGLDNAAVPSLAPEDIAGSVCD